MESQLARPRDSRDAENRGRDLENITHRLINDYERILHERVNCLSRMIKELKTVWSAKEKAIAADEDILRLKQ